MHKDSNTFLASNDIVTVYLGHSLLPPEQPRIEVVSVRFGNVLGSNESVILRFRE